MKSSKSKEKNSHISTSARKGAVHKVPVDLIKHLSTSSVAVSAWNDITPLARNEWVCWVTSAKKAETRVG